MPLSQQTPKTYTLLTSIHNDADDVDNYNRVIGIAQLKAFSCAKSTLKKNTDHHPSKNENTAVPATHFDGVCPMGRHVEMK